MSYSGCQRWATQSLYHLTSEITKCWQGLYLGFLSLYNWGLVGYVHMSTVSSTNETIAFFFFSLESSVSLNNFGKQISLLYSVYKTLALFTVKASEELKGVCLPFMRCLLKEKIHLNVIKGLDSTMTFFFFLLSELITHILAGMCTAGSTKNRS